MPNWTGRKRYFLVALALSGLFLVYVYQHFDYLLWLANLTGFGSPSDSESFAVNRTIRLVINDLLCLVLINELFREAKFVKVAFYVFLAELLILLPVYLWIKLSLEGPSEISSPLLQPIHRMIVNPLLMIILIGSFYYQQWRAKAT